MKLTLSDSQVAKLRKLGVEPGSVGESLPMHGFGSCHVMDGATTLTEAAGKIEAFAREVRVWEVLGYRLGRPIEDGHASLIPPAALEED